MIIREKDFNGFIKGYEKSFENIFRQYYKTRVFFSMRHGLEQMEAEDVVIETLHHVWELHCEIFSPTALNNLLYSSVHNRSLNVIRNIKNRERIIGNHQEENPEPEYRDYVMEEEMSRLLDQAIEALPVQCRKVILLLMKGKKISEVAAEMNISVNTAKTYRLRAIEILREILQQFPSLLWLVLFRIEI